MKKKLKGKAIVSAAFSKKANQNGVYWIELTYEDGHIGRYLPTENVLHEGVFIAAATLYEKYGKET